MEYPNFHIWIINLVKRIKWKLSWTFPVMHLKIYSSTNTTHQSETLGNEKDDWLLVLLVIGIIVVVCFSLCMLYVYFKRSKSVKIIFVMDPLPSIICDCEGWGSFYAVSLRLKWVSCSNLSECREEYLDSNNLKRIPYVT